MIRISERAARPRCFTCYGDAVRAVDIPGRVAAALADPEPGDRITVEAAGIPWSALVWGAAAARPLLLIHGVTSSAAAWWRIGPALAASGRRVTAVDQAGHGRTGHWTGHIGFRDNAADIAAFARAAGVATGDLQVIGHSWGGVTAAALPAVGLRPSTLVLLDPPVLPLALIALEASDPAQRTFDDIAEAIAAVRAAEPAWSEGDVRAKAEALVQLDESAAEAVLLQNGDWDGGLADLRDPAAAGVDAWVVRGEPATGGYVNDEAVGAFEAVIGADHVITIRGGSHSPQRLQPVETMTAFLQALGDA
jgi:pimeloyl-ACP methyl ester carboxylesterase